MIDILKWQQHLNLSAENMLDAHEKISRFLLLKNEECFKAPTLFNFAPSCVYELFLQTSPNCNKGAFMKWFCENTKYIIEVKNFMADACAYIVGCKKCFGGKLTPQITIGTFNNILKIIGKLEKYDSREVFSARVYGFQKICDQLSCDNVEYADRLNSMKMTCLNQILYLSMSV